MTGYQGEFTIFERKSEDFPRYSGWADKKLERPIAITSLSQLPYLVKFGSRAEIIS
jgi:hypothetical protein